MWKEWTYNYHSFNSMRILAEKEHAEKVLVWMRGDSKELPPPLSVTVDPTNNCNVNCMWCKNRDFRNNSPTSIPDGIFISLPNNLSEWGVKNITLSGGEPLLHPKIQEFLAAAYKNEQHIGVKTNGTSLNNEKIRELLLRASWVGVTVDAATEATYQKIKKAPLGTLEKVINGIQSLVSERGKEKSPVITMKFIIHHLNYADIRSFCSIAKRIGVDEVHIRPMWLPHYKYGVGVRKISEIYIKDARLELESPDFHIYGIVQKVGRDWDKIVRFERCSVLPLTGVFAANKVFYLCPDRRGDNTLNLGKYDNFSELIKLWGSQEHLEKIISINPKDCPKCGLTLTNEVIESCLSGRDRLLSEFI